MTLNFFMDRIKNGNNYNTFTGVDRIGGVYGKMSIDKESYEILCSIHNRMDHHERHMRIALRMEILYKN